MFEEEDYELSGEESDGNNLADCADTSSVMEGRRKAITGAALAFFMQVKIC